jgi:hypothetical protein
MSLLGMCRIDGLVWRLEVRNNFPFVESEKKIGGG